MKGLWNWTAPAGDQMFMCRTRLRATAGVMIALAVLTLASSTAAAHAELQSSNPAADAVLPVTPSEIVLTFTESVNMVPDSIRVVTSDGVDVDVGTIRQDEGDDSVAADLPALADGSYVVAWRAVSVDSHQISGAFTFSVGEPTSTNPGLVASLLAGTKPSDGSERWLGVGRGASYLGITALIGIAAVLSLLAPQLLPGRRAGRVLLGCVAIAVVGTSVMIAAQASVAVGDWTAWGEVYDSSAGRWWVIRLALVALAVVPIVARRRVAALGWWPTAMAVFVGCLLAVVAQGGHGAAGQHPTAGLIATVVHLAAISMWIGGLAAITLVAPRWRVVSLAAEFSQIALWSVVVLAASGLFNSWRQVGSWGRLTDSDYGTWLIVKLTVLGAVLAVAATSRWLVTHQTQALESETPETPETTTLETEESVAAPARPGPALGRTVIAELAGMVLVFAATAGLVNSAPPRAAAGATAASATVVESDRIAQITLDPAVTGGTAMHLYLSSSIGSLEQPTDITVTATLASQDIGPLTIPTIVAGPGHVTSPDANLPIAGAWTFTITAKYGEFDQTVFVAELDVR